MDLKSRLFIFISLALFLVCFQFVYAADGSGTCTLSPDQVIENTDTTLTFTFTATETMDGGSITIQAPSGWSAPQGSSGTAGYTVGSTDGTIGTLTFSGQVVTVPITALANTETITVVYGSGGGGSSARVQDISGRGGTVTFTVSAKSSGAGILTAISSSPTIEVVERPEFDSTPPVSVLTNPINEEIIDSSSYVIKGTAEDSGGATPVGVAWVKVGINNVWVEARSIGQGYSTWEYVWEDIIEGDYTIQTKSGDWRGNNEVAGESIGITVSFTQEEDVEDEVVVDEEDTFDEETGDEETEGDIKQISEMTDTELRAKIIEIQQAILEILIQLVQLLQEQAS
ncbi:MAG: hypothetical protein U9Q96_01860 [Patescibacteria group bacterium]|nr:hypothetical protein [Patescibacteria group bacterium]